MRDPMEIPRDMTYKRQHNAMELVEKYMEAVGRGQRNIPPSEATFRPLVSKKIVSVASKIVYLLRRLWSGEKVEFDSLFVQCKSRSEMVAIFLAVLELSKVNRINVDTDNDDVQIQIVKGS